MSDYEAPPRLADIAPAGRRIVLALIEAAAVHDHIRATEAATAAPRSPSQPGRVALRADSASGVGR